MPDFAGAQRKGEKLYAIAAFTHKDLVTGQPDAVTYQFTACTIHIKDKTTNTDIVAAGTNVPLRDSVAANTVWCRYLLDSSLSSYVLNDKVSVVFTGTFNQSDDPGNPRTILANGQISVTAEDA